jgi:hypothetical protein
VKLFDITNRFGVQPPDVYFGISFPRVSATLCELAAEAVLADGHVVVAKADNEEGLFGRCVMATETLARHYDPDKVFNAAIPLSRDRP